MGRLYISEVRANLEELEAALVKARVLIGILRSSDNEKERVLRHMEKLLCEVLEDFNKIEVGEKEVKNVVSGMD